MVRRLGKAPDGEIVISKGTDGLWQFEAGTVAGAEDLFESVKDVAPSYPRDGDEMLQRIRAILRPTWSETPWWGWFALGGCILVGFVAGTIIGKLGRKVATVAADRDLDLIARVVREAAPVLGLAVFAVATVAGTGFMEFGPTLAAWRWTLAQLLALVVIGYAVFKLAGIAGAVLANRTSSGDESYAKTIVPFIVEAVRFVVALVFVAVVLQNLFGVSVGALLTSFGAVGLALGLAAKESVRNWLGAMTIFLAKPFEVNDWIIFDNLFGQVERVSLNATHIRTVRGEVMIVPNMKFIDGTVLNANRRHYLRRTMNLALPYDTTPKRLEKALKIVRETLTGDDVREDGSYEEVGKEPHVTFQNFEADHLQIRAYYWFRIPPSEAGWYDFLEHNDLVNRRLLEAFDEAGLSFAFPTQTIRLTDDSERGFAIDMPGKTEE